MPSRYDGPPRDILALNAFIALMRAAESLTTRLDGPLAAAGLTHGQFAVLECLLHLGPLPQNEIARKILRSGGNITKVVDNLERDGLVRRRRDTNDRRVHRVDLTPAGRRRIAALFPAHARRIADEMAILTVAEQRELRRLCRSVGLRQRTDPETPNRRSP